MKTLLQLYRELLPKQTEAAELKEVLTKVRSAFPIGVKVKIIDTSYTAEVIKYNERLGGFYPGVRYPIIVKILSSGAMEFQGAVGMLFEYMSDQIKIIGEQHVQNNSNS